MPRQPRIVIPDIAHHVIQRGNYRQNIFDNQKDYIQYCQWINEYALKYKIEIFGYCLMNNHVHLIVIPQYSDGLAKLFNTAHMRYSQYLNGRRGLKGHLWQGRFYSCLLDEAHLYRAIRYVENNPVRAGIVKEAWNYKWSSAIDHVNEREEKPPITLKKYKGIEDVEWKQYLREYDADMTEEIRLKTYRGLVLGTDVYI